MTRRLLSWLLLLCLCLAFGAAAFAEGDDEEVSIEIFKEIEEEIAQANAEPTPEPPRDITKAVYEADGSIVITMSFAGDVIIGTNTQSSQDSLFEKELEKQDNDRTFPFRNVKDIFDADDLTMINFEGTLTTADQNTDKLDSAFLFRANPSYSSMLSYGGVDIATLENDHVLDMGETGLADTKAALDKEGITYVTEDQCAILVRRGLKIGSLAYQAYGRYDELMLKVPGDIEALRILGCDIVLVSYHWGRENVYSPDEEQVTLAHGTVDAGADLVIGNHAGRINPIEYYNERYICYSLGNFIYAGDNKPSDMSAFIFQIKMRVLGDTVSSDQIKIIPCRISSRRDYNDFAPTPYSKDENIEAILRTIRQNGKDLPYAITEFPLTWVGEE